jgi:hypothetical protein
VSHEKSVIHEDAEVEECGRNVKGADVVLNDSFAVKVEDAGEFVVCY